MMADLVDHDMADQRFERDAGLRHFGQQRTAVQMVGELVILMI